MLLKVRAIPALPRTPASAVPLASNALPTPGMLALRVAVGFQGVGTSVEAVDFQVVVGSVEVVVAQDQAEVAVDVQVAAEGEADD